jgi:hypothetical protein
VGQVGIEPKTCTLQALHSNDCSERW